MSKPVSEVYKLWMNTTDSWEEKLENSNSKDNNKYHKNRDGKWTKVSTMDYKKNLDLYTAKELLEKLGRNLKWC